MALKRNPEIKTTLLPDGHVVLFSTKTDWAQILNPTGALVWEFCDGEHETDGIVTEIVKLTELQQSPGLSQEVQTLVGELLQSGLLVRD